MTIRKRQSDKKPVSAIDLGQLAGLTLMTDSTASDVIDRLPTMIPSLDYILGGGLPFGRVTELYGLNASGKSSMAVHLTKQAQQYGVPVVWADVEGTASADNMVQLGADPSNIFLIQPKEGEHMTIEMVTEKIKEVILTFGRAGLPVLIIWDSLASTAAEQQLKEGFNPNQMGVTARAITNMTIQIGQSVNQNNVAFVILNQARDDLKAHPNFPKIKSTGGRALEHWCSLRLEVVRASQFKEKVVDPASGREVEEYAGHIMRLKTEKSKVSRPRTQAEVFLVSNPYIGLDFVENVYRAATDQYGIISKGAWRKYITDNGEEISKRHADWVPYLRSEEGAEVLKEIFTKQLLSYFPNGYSPLNNHTIDVTDDVYLQQAMKYYEDKQKAGTEPEANADADTNASKK